MASTFHTPSFGDEDFNIPSLALPTSDGSTGLYGSPAPPTSDYSIQANNSGPQSVSSSASSGHVQGHPIQGHQGQGHFSPSFPPAQNGFHSYPQGTSQGYNFLPKFPPQTFEIPDIQVSNSLGVNQMKNTNLITTTTVMATSQAMVLEMPENSHGGGAPAHGYPATRGHTATQISPPASNTTSPGRESSAEESSSDDSVPLAQLAQKRNAPPPPAQPKVTAAKKPRTPKKRKKKDPNEPQKPVSAYALFFRDTQAAIKTRNPNASFGEVSKIVASMWDGLEEDHKNDYKKRTEAAKKEYLKQLAAYRATLVSQGALDSGEPRNNSSPKQQQQQQHSSPSRQPILSNPAMTTVPMTTHPMTSSISMPHMPGMPLSHMPHANNVLTHNPGHMISPPHHQHYGMLPPPHQSSHMVAPPMGMLPPPGAMSPDTMVASPPEALGMHDGYMGTPVLPGSPPMAMDSPTALMCVRNGCGNPAIQNHTWDNEYCSNDCVVNHCRDAFTQWVASRQGQQGPYASVK